MKTAVLFPGQGAQAPGMMKDVIDAYPAARERMDLASALLGRDLYALTMCGTQGQLNQTENTQPCLLACELAAFRVYRQLGLPCEAAAGFSLGEWAAMAASGALDEASVLRTIEQRAAAMQRAVPAGEGGMAVVLGRDAAFVEDLCRSAGEVAPANYNCPGNITVAGTAEGIERLLKTAGSQGVAASRVAVSVPSHCALMAPAAEELRPLVQALSFQNPRLELVMNAAGRAAADPGEIRENLIQQLVRPVLFQQSVEHLLAEGYDTFVEIGPGKALSNMVKRTAKAAGRSVRLLPFSSLETVEAARKFLADS